MIRECFVVITVWTFFHLTGGNDLPPPCESTIYCHGSLLNTIQMKRIYPDSKTFVDLKLKYPPNETMQRFNDFIEDNGGNPDKIAVEVFVKNTFDPAGSEFEEWVPDDWIENPHFLKSHIHDVSFQKWGFELNGLWKLLGRKMKKDVFQHQDLYSIIWVPHPVIVPGGRFREFYYWDSYWIIRGLMISEMHSTARGMLENFFYIVEKFGFIPNGGRIYYARRSQPPVLIPMAKTYFEFSNDLDFVRHNIATMEKEFNFWLTNHTVSIQKDGRNYTLAVYGDQSTGPRPESYYEDIESARIFETNEQKEAFYSELKAAAESGWDFSSRWFIRNKTNTGNLTDLHTRSIVPVDLNSIMYGNAIILSEFYQILNNTDKMHQYEKIALEWREAVSKVLWHSDVGAWLDYDLINNIRRDYFYPTNIAPLWTNCYDPKQKDVIVNHVLNYLDNKKIWQHQGGVPTTDEHTGEQWDFPNAWPPLQHIMIVGLENTGNDYAQRLAYELTEKWVRSNYQAHHETNAMFEKYDATTFGGYGGGGEYEIQLGFGWTNGIILDLLHMYGDRLTLNNTKETTPQRQTDSPDDNRSTNTAATTTFSQVVTGLLALLIPLTTGFIG